MTTNFLSDPSNHQIAIKVDKIPNLGRVTFIFAIERPSTTTLTFNWFYSDRTYLKSPENQGS